MTDGVDLARRQLLDLIEVADGAVALLEERISGVGAVFTISLDTSGLPHCSDGVELRARERFEVVVVDGEYPFSPPYVRSVHWRWAGTPHVQWGRQLCLYLAPSVEWSPSDGMRGLIGRLSEWLEHAAAGTLDPDGQPLHPPVAYSNAQTGIVVIHPDVAQRVPWCSDGRGDASSTLFAWCVVQDRRIDVLEWLSQIEAVNRAFDMQAPVFEHGKPLIVIPATLIPGQFGFEFPSMVRALGAGLAGHGYDNDQLLWDLGTSSLINRQLRQRQKTEDAAAAGELWDENDDDDAPLFTAMLVGTPSRRIDTDRLAHLAAWRLDSLSSQISDLFGSVRSQDDSELPERVRVLALGWFESAKVSWMRVMENRPEVTRRRDDGKPSNWLQGKRVLVLGSGAVGAPVSEFCVRAGVEELTVADSGVVTPGILVRQPYTDTDIGRSKAIALAERLSTIRDDLTVTPSCGNVRTRFFDTGQSLAAYDLIIDATADESVRATIELARKRSADRPPLVTILIGHNAELGLVATNLPQATGGGSDALRKVALLTGSNALEWADIRSEFFPRTPRTELFFPEPGCSAPTFVGSAAEVTALAAMLLTEALRVLDSAVDPGPDEPVSFAAAVRLGAASTRGTSRIAWLRDVAHDEVNGTFEVRISRAALAEARAEVRRGARVRGRAIETGGMLLGAFDDATGIVYIDKFAGPPPDSYLSESYFQHGTVGAQDRVDSELERSGGLTGFVGIWHTHPGQRAYPSPTDEQGMASVVAPDGTTRRALMMILGGCGDSWEAWRAGHSGSLPDIYTRVVPRSSGPVTSGPPGYVGGLDLQRLPVGTYFRGGYRGMERDFPGSGSITSNDGGQPQRWKSGHRWPWQRRQQ